MAADPPRLDTPQAPAAVLGRECPRVGSGATWTSVRAGYAHTWGIRSDHGLWCWGDNGEGQLGLGDYNGRLVPTQV